MSKAAEPAIYPCRLYLITPPALEPAHFAPLLESALDGGDVACVQLRLKDASDAQWRAAIAKLMPLVQARKVAFIINDHPALAAEMGADGCHVGQDDMPYAQARQTVGKNAIVGVTCHNSRHLAMVAGEAGADYVAFGAFFPTETKTASHTAEPEILEWWSAIFETPSVAIGGINAGNCAALVRAGADFLAVSAGVWAHPGGPGAGVKALNDAIKAAKN